MGASACQCSSVSPASALPLLQPLACTCPASPCPSRTASLGRPSCDGASCEVLRQTVLRFSEVLHRVFRAWRRGRPASTHAQPPDASLPVPGGWIPPVSTTTTPPYCGETSQFSGGSLVHFVPGIACESSPSCGSASPSLTVNLLQ